MPPIEISLINSTVVVSYPMRYAQQTITRAEYSAVRVMSEHRRVDAIKFIRDQYALGLYEAKQIVDTICDNPAAI
jgi:ribosomal protein L7/L12